MSEPERPAARSRFQRGGEALPIAFLAVVAIAFYPEIVLPHRILADYDVWTYFYPLRAYAARAIQEGRFPLWNPDTFLGAPFFANPQTSILYPGSVLFYVLPVPYAYSLSVILHVFLAAALTYRFLRRAFGVGTIAALVGACAFAFGGFVSSQVGHINQLSATALMPGIALCAVLAARRRSLRWALGGALGFAAQLLAGHAQESYMTLWIVGVLLLWELARQTWGAPPLGQELPVPNRFERLQRTPMRVFLRVIGIGMVISIGGFALAAIQLVPTAELSSASIRGGGMTFEEATSFSLPPNLLARSLLPGYWYNPFGEYIGYVGGVALGFAGLGFLFGRRGPVWCGVALVVIGLFLALGNGNPLAPALYKLVPGLNLFRVPARWLLVVSFGIAILTAVGVDWALSQAQDSSTVTRARRRLASRLGTPLWRPAVLAVSVVAVGATAFIPVRSVPGRILLLWTLTVGAAFLLAALARRLPPPAIAAAIGVAILADLRLAAMDLPQRHAVPRVVAEESRPVPNYLRERGDTGRVLSIARTEYELPDIAEINTRHPGLSETAQFWFTSAMKLDEVMSPNTPLRHGLSTVDGYDGGVLPLRRYLDIASLLIPREELRSDGVLRTRLIAVPETRYLDLLGIHTIIAGKSVDLELAGVRYDVATARTIAPGERVQLPLPEGLQLASLGMLASVADPVAATSGEIVLTRLDGSQDRIPLRPNLEIFGELAPGPTQAGQPTAGLNRAPRMDTAVRIAVPHGLTVTHMEWTWSGPGRLALRAATAIGSDGSQRQIVLQEGLTVVDYPSQKLFQRPVSSDTSLFPWSDVRLDITDDPAALQWLRSASGDDLKNHIALAPETLVFPTPGDMRDPRGPDQPPGSFRRGDGPPERVDYHRVTEGAPGYLMFRDAWFPGWRAEIDGRPAAVQRANILFKAVWVPASARQVTFVFEPVSVRIGAAVSVLALVLWIGLMIRGRLPLPGVLR